jgi:branched-chain amino acid transport system ATP-binding protein
LHAGRDDAWQRREVDDATHDQRAHPASQGEIRFEGTPIHTLPAHKLVSLGISQAPEGRRIFGTLTARENLGLGAFTLTDNAKIDETLQWIYRLFPILEKRREQLGGTLSNKALLANPKVQNAYLGGGR